MKTIKSSHCSSLHCFYTNCSRYRHDRFHQQQNKIQIRYMKETLHAYTLHLSHMFSWNNRRGKDLSTDTAPVFVQKVLLFCKSFTAADPVHKFEGNSLYALQSPTSMTNSQVEYILHNAYTHIHTKKISKKAFEWPFCCSLIQPPGRTYP